MYKIHQIGWEWIEIETICYTTNLQTLWQILRFFQSVQVSSDDYVVEPNEFNLEWQSKDIEIVHKFKVIVI